MQESPVAAGGVSQGLSWRCWGWHAHCTSWHAPAVQKSVPRVVGVWDPPLASASCAGEGSWDALVCPGPEGAVGLRLQGGNLLVWVSCQLNPPWGIICI